MGQATGHWTVQCWMIDQCGHVVWRGCHVYGYDCGGGDDDDCAVVCG